MSRAYVTNINGTESVWVEVTPTEWDNLTESNREILITSNGTKLVGRKRNV